MNPGFPSPLPLSRTLLILTLGIFLSLTRCAEAPEGTQDREIGRDDAQLGDSSVTDTDEGDGETDCLDASDATAVGEVDEGDLESPADAGGDASSDDAVDTTFADVAPVDLQEVDVAASDGDAVDAPLDVAVDAGDVADLDGTDSNDGAVLQDLVVARDPDVGVDLDPVEDVAIELVDGGGPVPYELDPRYATTPLWIRVWGDEFDGGERQGPDDPCYTRAPMCTPDLGLYVEACDPDALPPGLENLNRCNWTILNGYNIWSDQASSFDPQMVSMENGEIVFYSAGLEGPYDCGNPAGPWSRTADCPFVSGGLWSQRYIDIWSGTNAVDQPGYIKRFGRFEVRARLSSGPGSWPGLWLLNQGGGWPGGGEIDIAEYQATHPDRVIQTVHAQDGDIHSSANGELWAIDAYADTFIRDYHVFSVEWQPGEIRFYTDNRLTREVRSGTPLTDQWTSATCTMTNPDVYPYYWIVGNGIHRFPGVDFGGPPSNPLDLLHRELRVDYVRVYDPCDADDCCPDGGVYDRTNGRCYHGPLWTPSPCAENTLSPQCRYPCAGVGFFDGYNCFLRDAPEGRHLYIEDGHFRYRRQVPCTSGRASCRAGDEWISLCDGCDAGPVPAGREEFIAGSAFYVTSLCSTTAAQPPCANPCPHGGQHDGQNCFLARAPAGTNPFIYERHFYYQPVQGHPDGPCPYTTDPPYSVEFDGYNCHVAIPVPIGADPFIYDRGYYFMTTCGRIYDWQSLDPASVGEVTQGDGCSPL